MSITTFGSGLDHPEGIAWDPAGAVVVGTESGSVLWLDPVTAEASAYTNALALSPDGTWQYVVEISLPGVSRIPVAADGSLGQREVVVEIPETVPDGLAFTADGRMLVSFYRPDAVRIWDGTHLDVLIHDWTGLTLSAPTNVAFAGDDATTLLAANLGTWHLTRIEADLRGAPLHYPRLS